MELSKRIQSHYEVLNRIGATPPGFTRRAYSKEESEAFNYFSAIGEKIDLIEYRDPIGNLYLRTPWKRDHVIQIGSHLDTVRCGGNFDGVVGVIAGAVVIEELMSLPETNLAYDIELVIWRCEESAFFGKGMLGSEGAFFGLSAEDLKRSDGTITLRDALQDEIGEEAITCIMGGEPALPKKFREEIATYLELHIEQQRILEREKKTIGIVTSIRGPKRYRCKLQANGNNSALSVGLAEIIVTLDEATQEMNSKGVDLVSTIGVVSTECAPTDSPLKQCGLSSIAGYSEVLIKNSPSSNLSEILKSVEELYGVRSTFKESEDRILFEGRFDHSGSTPMGTLYRSDANLALAKLITLLSNRSSETEFIVNYPESPDTIEFLVDIRGSDKASRDDGASELLKLFKEIADRNEIQFQSEILSQGDPIESLDLNLRDTMKTICEREDIPHMELPSGAGHDVVNPAKSGIPSALLFIPCRDGISHNPDEYATIDDISSGTFVLLETVKELLTTEVLGPPFRS